MRIVLFGATGEVGESILGEALSRSHRVTAVSRDPSRLEQEYPPATVLAGDVTDRDLVRRLADGADALVSAVGGAADGRPEVVVEAAHSLLDAAGDVRIFAIGGAGSLNHPAGGTVASQPDFPDSWKPSSDAQERALEVYRTEGAGRNWTYLSPAHVLEPGERTGHYRTGEDTLVTDKAGESRISTADYAIAVLDELESPRFTSRRFTVAW